MLDDKLAKSQAVAEAMREMIERGRYPIDEMTVRITWVLPDDPSLDSYKRYIRDAARTELRLDQPGPWFGTDLYVSSSVRPKDGPERLSTIRLTETSKHWPKYEEHPELWLLVNHLDVSMFGFVPGTTEDEAKAYIEDGGEWPSDLLDYTMQFFVSQQSLNPQTKTGQGQVTLKYGLNEGFIGMGR